MARGILVVGESGSGKSSSIENLNSEETFIINCKGKSLPFQGWKGKYKNYSSENPKGNYYSTDQTNVIMKLMDEVNKMTHIKVLILDDFQYVSAALYMDKSGEKGFDKFVLISKNLYLMADKPRTMRDDLTVVFMNHAEQSQDLDGNRRLKAMTIGKMVDNVITLEGLFTVVLFTKVVNDGKGNIKYQFLTQSDGSCTAKSPKGMLEQVIPNDIDFVINKMIEYEK